MSAAAEVSWATPLYYEASRAIREGRDFPEVQYPRNTLVPADTPEYIRQAMRRWHQWASRVIDLCIDDDFRRLTAEKFPPPMDREWLVWMGDVFHDKLFRQNAGYLAVLFLSCALYENDTKGIAKEMSVVLDRAGEGSPKWARREAAWRGLRALDGSRRKGKPKNGPLAYMRAYVARVAKTTACRYGAERPNDLIRLAGHTRLSPELIDNPAAHLEKTWEKWDEPEEDNVRRAELLSHEALEKLVHPSPEVIMLVEERKKESEQTVKMISECCRLGEPELLKLIMDAGISPSEAQRRLEMPAGTYRNLVKRIRRQFSKRPK